MPPPYGYSCGPPPPCSFATPPAQAFAV
jgi:hypothetical protein